MGVNYIDNRSHYMRTGSLKSGIQNSKVNPSDSVAFSAVADIKRYPTSKAILTAKYQNSEVISAPTPDRRGGAG
jgi:hypothetical protein